MVVVEVVVEVEVELKAKKHQQDHVMSEFQAVGSRGRQKPSVRRLKSTVQYLQNLLSSFKIRYAISVLYNVDLSFKREFVQFTERYKSLNNQSSSSCIHVTVSGKSLIGRIIEHLIAKST